MRELRLIAEHKPKYNRRSRFPEKVHYLKLTREPWPRLSLVRRVLDDGADYLGPFSSKKTAEKCLAALHETFPVRQCSGRLPRRPRGARLRARRDGPVPLALRRQRRHDDVRRRRATAARQRCCAAPDDVVEPITPAHDRAGRRRALRGGRRPPRPARRLRPGRRPHPAAVGADPHAPSSSPPGARTTGRWAVHVVRHGRLAAAGVIPPGRRRPPVRRRARRAVGGDRRRRPRPGARRDTAEESEQILRWLESDRACGWSTSTASGPARSAARPATSRSTTRSSQSRLDLVPFDDRRSIRTVAPAGPRRQPVR